MINIFCDKCRHDSKAKLNLRTEGDSIVIECLKCGEMKRFGPEEEEDVKKEGGE